MGNKTVGDCTMPRPAQHVGHKSQGFRDSHGALQQRDTMATAQQHINNPSTMVRISHNALLHEDTKQQGLVKPSCFMHSHHAL